MKQFRRARWLALGGMAALLLGCGGGGSPQPGSFKRAPESWEVAKNNNAATATTQAGPAPANAAQVGAVPANVAGATANAQTSQQPGVPANAGSIPDLPPAASVQIEPVDPAWPPAKKHEQTVARLRKIALAIREYAVKEGCFPAAPGQLHSWRVLILPYLGHADQFARFNLQLPWDSDTNAAAAKQVPDVYRSPWRSDSLTCFQAPLGQNAILASAALADRLNGEWSSIVELLMVEDEYAVPWNKPADFVLTNGDRPIGNLGQDRTGFLVVLPDAQVRWLPADTQGTSVRSLMTIGGGEYARVSVLTQEESAGLPFFQIAASFNAKPVDVPNDAPPAAATTSSNPLKPRLGSILQSEATDERIPLPSEDEIEKARLMLKQVFKDEIEQARKGDKTRSKHDLAVQLLRNAKKVEGEPAAYFVLLQTARDNAADVGDFKLAQQASEALIKCYQVNDLELRRRTVTEAGKALFPYFADQNDDLREECEQVLKLALARDDFEAAKDAFETYAETTRRLKPGRPSKRFGSRKRSADKHDASKQEFQRLQIVEKEIENIKRAHASASPAFKTLQDSPDDADANYTVGAYLCLVKFQWLDGAKHLMKGSNLRLKVLATEDQAPPVGPAGMADLANEYWVLSEQETGLFKRGLQLRAIYWYSRALPDLSAGLTKVQAERRSAEADKTYGEDLVDAALAMMDPEIEKAVAQSID